MIFIGIQVIDAQCGAGKTEYIIRYLNKNQDRPFLYISPLREMFDRIEGKGIYEGKGINREVYTPDTNNRSHTMLQGLKEMIDVGVDIVSTHALFLRLDDEAIQKISDRNYLLIIDEALDVVSVLPTGKNAKEEDFEFRELKKSITVEEVEWLQRNDLIRIDKDNYNQVVWTNADDIEHRYTMKYIHDWFNKREKLLLLERERPEIFKEIGEDENNIRDAIQIFIPQIKIDKDADIYATIQPIK